MAFSHKLPPGVRRLFRLPRSRARILRDMEEEVRAHIAMRAEELRALGMTQDDAQREALRRFGDADEFHTHVARRATRQARWSRAFEWLDDWRQDVRFANRQFRRNAAFTALAVLTLALGIGANTAIFTVVHRLLLSPLPYADGDRIVMLAMEGDDRSPTQPGRPAMLAWRARARSVETIAAVAVLANMVQDARELDTIPAFVTTNYMQLLGVRPVVGRGFTPDDERPGAMGVAMITYGQWQRAYGGRADALGSPVRANGKTYTIVGVTPPEMAIPMSVAGAGAKLHEAAPSIWLPVSFDSLAASHSPFVVAAGGAAVFAKLRADVSTRQASDELQSIIESTPASERFAGWSPWTPHCCARALRAQDLLDPREARAIEVLFAAVGVLLLIACANVANLLMSRAWTRRREFAVRLALGAGRARLARLVLTESVELALAGGALGVIVAWQTLRVILALRPPALSNLDGVHLALPVLVWSLGISIATGILFGSAPALFAGGRSFGDALRSGTRASSSDGVSRRIRSGLIVAEIALSLVLLVGAGLLLRSFVALQRMPLGFEPRGLLAIDFHTRWSPQPDERIALRSALLERVRAAPGVTEAAIGTMPGDPNTAVLPLETEPDADGRTRSVPRFSVTFVSPNYFRVARISLVEGRSPEQTPAAATEIVVNRSLARRFWPNGRVLGARLHAASEAYTVVGVVDDMRMPGPQAAITAVIYRPPPAIVVPFIVRVPTAAPGLAAMLRRAATEVDPSASIRVMTIGDDYLRDALAPTRFATALLGAFSLLALTLSAVGLYGVIAYSVTQRTREIGIRVALGAAPNEVTSRVVGGGLKLAAVGTLAGAVAAALSTRVLASMLYAVSPADPLTFLVIATIVVAIAALASYVPARRALRIDPTEALRAD
jgi:putative ABC transport system permease protein